MDTLEYMNRNIRRRRIPYWIDDNRDDHYEVEHKLKELEQADLGTYFEDLD